MSALGRFVPLTILSAERLLFSIADIQISANSTKRQAGSGQKRTLPEPGYSPFRLIVGPSDQTSTMLSDNNKAKPAERRGRKDTGPRFLREVTDDLPKDPKTTGLSKLQPHCPWSGSEVDSRYRWPACRKRVIIDTRPLSATAIRMKNGVSGFIGRWRGTACLAIWSAKRPHTH